ncbi:MAG: hypothetical protein AAF296_06025 [Pseudomonadota bacterium]
MTATQINPNGFTNSLIEGLKQGLSWFAKGLLAVALVVLAGLLAVMTAIVGMVIASAALLIRLMGPKNETGSFDVTEDGEGLTLEARKTARGWTVE